tara:strand:+ start:239 stop:877 length:639 start_codon:yes stop_codon:yes gene_type:complete
MKKNNLIIISLFLLMSNFVFTNLYSKISNIIVVKVGGSLITSLDVKNEILTNLVINKQEITQENINNNKNFAIKNLINKSIKMNEINRFEIKDYNSADLKNYLENISKNLNTNSGGLRKIFEQNEINYEIFVGHYKTELLWNTLIFELYKNSTNINIIEVDTEVEKIKGNKSEEELKKIREKISNIKREEKLNLFSRSHFSNLENTVTVNFQ